MTDSIEQGRFDLHTHSSFSDGTTSPLEIANLARDVGLDGFALTDHDTIEGWEEARAAATHNNIDFLPGLEMTTEAHGRSMHLLAYGPIPDDEELMESLSRLRNARVDRSKEIISRLKQDFTLDWEAVLQPVYEGKLESIGRPHLADALIDAGFFTDRAEVFSDVLSPQSKYYVHTAYIDTIKAIQIVRKAGGFPVLAHPAAFRMRRPIEDDLVRHLQSKGLGGIELNHPENREDWLPGLTRVAAEENLLVTGSSDYHGSGKPNRLGERSSSLQTVELIRAEVATPR